MNKKYKITYSTKFEEHCVILIFTSNKFKAWRWFKENHPKDKLINIERVMY